MNAHQIVGRGTGTGRPRVDGKFLEVDGRRFLVKGVSYGTFAPDRDGVHFPTAERVDADFAAMAASGVNTVRTYTVPTPTLLDTAARNGLKVIAGIAWPQHISFLDDRGLARRIRRDIAEAVRGCADHPAALLFAVGNEIPPGIVRWHGPRRVERFLHDVYHEVKAAAPDSLLTYSNFPPTEHLELDAFDVLSLNVYLHRERDLRDYLARMQHRAGSRPLLLTEAGADSIREGADGQARLTAAQVRAAFAEGACGAVVFSWTDEWWRGGRTVDDWAFGLVDAERRPKPALSAVERVFADAPFPEEERARWPSVSVVVCAYDAADTIDDCMTSLRALRYPDVEVIVVNDGSRDGTGEIARAHPGVKVIDVPNGGLSAARNVGLAEASGEVVAYTDADVRVDPDWLTYLVQPLLDSSLVGVGGPNVVPADDPWVAQCVARAPGAPTHVMLDDRIAEHVPGCNMAFRREALLEVDGFNPVYVRAGDDVDICWRLQERGYEIGFAPSALVWHRHRTSVRAYWRQQVGYGEGETWLDVHHPEKFLGGHMTWRGSIYSPLPFLRRASERRVNTGVWGTAAFPSVYSTHGNGWHHLPHTPAWMLGSFALFNVGFWGPLAGMDAAWLPLIAGTLGGAVTVARSARCAWQSPDVPELRGRGAGLRKLRHRALITWLHLIQPLARFRGRLRGLSRGPRSPAPQHTTRHPWKPTAPKPGDVLSSARLWTGSEIERSYWSESWVSQASLLTELVGELRSARPAQVVDVDEGWRPDRDLSVAVGRWGWLHLRSVVEEHEKGASLFRVRTRLRPSVLGTLRGTTLAVVVAGGASASMFIYDLGVTLFVAALAITGLGARTAWQAFRAVSVLDRALGRVTAAAGMLKLPVASESERRRTATTRLEQARAPR